MSFNIHSNLRYRIGQERDTEFVKLTVVGSVDDKIQEIKKRKNTDIAKVIKGQKKAQLELLYEILSEDMDSGDEEEQD